VEAFLLKIDEPYVSSLMEFFNPIPKENYEIEKIDLNSDVNTYLLDDEIAYKRALKDLENGDAVELNEYIAKRGLV
jgi:inorganic pyrophosphatase